MAAVALGGAALLATGCGMGGGAGTTPATTAKDGRAVYDPAHTGIALPPGPKFIIRMPAPEAGNEWRLTAPEDTGGVSLSGMQNADGGGDWYFDTIGAGGGTLEFRQTPIGSEDSTESVTFEVNIR